MFLSMPLCCLDEFSCHIRQQFHSERLLASSECQQILHLVLEHLDGSTYSTERVHSCNLRRARARTFTHSMSVPQVAAFQAEATPHLCRTFETLQAQEATSGRGNRKRKLSAAGLSSKRGGGGGAWRAFVHVRGQGAGAADFSHLAEVYRDLPDNEKEAFVSLGKQGTLLHRDGDSSFPRPFRASECQTLATARSTPAAVFRWCWEVPGSVLSWLFWKILLKIATFGSTSLRGARGGNGTLSGLAEPNVKDVEQVVKETLAEQPKNAENSLSRNKFLEEFAVHNAEEAMSGKGLLAATTQPYCRWFAVPSVCETLKAASTAHGLGVAKQSVVETLDRAWQQRHLGIRRRPRQTVANRPAPVCVHPAGCVCSGLPFRMYRKMQVALRVADQELLRRARVVFSLEIIAVDDVEAGRPALQERVVLGTRWFHVAYLSCSPWRVTLVELDLVNSMAEKVHDFKQLDKLFVRPCFQDGQPSIRPLQQLVNDVDSRWALSMTLFSLSSSKTACQCCKDMLEFCRQVQQHMFGKATLLKPDRCARQSAWKQNLRNRQMMWPMMLRSKWIFS